MSVIFPNRLTVDDKYAQDVNALRDRMESAGYLNSEINDYLNKLYSSSDPYGTATSGSSSGNAEDSADAMLKAQLAGLEAQKGYADEVLAGADTYKTEGLQTADDYTAAVTQLYQNAAQKALAQIQGVSDTDLRQGYDNAIKTYRNEIANINGIVTDALAFLDKEKAENPLYSLDRSLDTFRSTFENIAKQTANDLMDFQARTQNPGSLNNVRKSMASEMFGQMVSQVPQLHRQVQEANQWLTGERLGMQKWGGSTTAGLSSGLASAQIGKGRDLTDLAKWKAGGAADTYKWEAGGIGGAQTAGLNAKTNILNNALNAKSNALTNLGGIAGQTAYTESIKGDLNNILNTSNGGSALPQSFTQSLGLSSPVANKLNPTHTTYAYQNTMKGFADPTKKKTNAQNMYTV